MYCYAKYVPYTESDAFDPNFEYTTLHVPENSVYLYKKTKPWSGFGNILAIIPGDANGDGLVNVTDIVSTVNFIMEKPSQDFNEYAAECDGYREDGQHHHGSCRKRNGRIRRKHITFDMKVCYFWVVSILLLSRKYTTYGS